MRGIIFDLDGTLVDSGLDFDAMRQEMDLPPGRPILEAMEALEPDHAARCREILLRHEQHGADRAVLYPGVRSLLERLHGLGLKAAVLTRNSGQSAEAVLARLDLAMFFSPVISRDDGPVKPDPWAIHEVCAAWQVAVSEVAVVGDFVFDLLAGRNAGAATVLFTQGREPDRVEAAAHADYILRNFDDADDFVSWMIESG